VTTTVQVSALAGDRNLGGLTLPVFTNRSVTHEIRLAEGESNVLGGIITDTEAVSMAGIPGLKDIPILKYFFGQERKQRDETEIIIMLTPHILRMPNIKDINLRGLNVGSVNQPKLRADNAITFTAPTPATIPTVPTTPATLPPGAAGASTQPAAPTAPPPPPAPTNTTIAFAPSPVTLVATPGNGANVVSIVANGSVFGADLVLSFDPAAFSISQIREGGFLSRDGQLIALTQNIDSAAGTVRISLERPPGSAPVSGTGNLVTLVLEPGARKGSSTLKVTDFQVRDARQTVQAGRGAEVQINVP
jgi:general secretion pathway protein D